MQSDPLVQDAARDAGTGATSSPQLASAERAAYPSRPRGTGELIELYVTATALGVYTGVWIPYAAGLASDGAVSGSSSTEHIIYLLSMLAGGGVFAIGVAGLDNSGDGLQPGTAAAMSMGLRYGVASGVLLWGALDGALSSTISMVCDVTCRAVEHRAGFVKRLALPLGLGLGGFLISAIIGDVSQPDVPEVRFVEAGGLWGAGLGFLLSIAVQDVGQGLAITAGGLGLGLLCAAILASSGAEISPRRSWIATLALVLGAGVGATFSGIAAIAVGDFDPTMFGAATAAAGGAGLVLGLVFTQAVDDSIPRSDAVLNLRLDVAPSLDGRGGTISLGGSF